MGDLLLLPSETYTITTTTMFHNQQQQQQQHKKKMSNNTATDFDDLKDLEEMLSKLNPWAKEFVPRHQTPPFPASNTYLLHPKTPTPSRKNKGPAALGGNIYHQRNHRKRRINNRTNRAQRDDVIKRTVYVSDIHHQVTEQQLAALFLNCGQVVDCRICGDPKSVLRFAFIEFTHMDGARNALSLNGSMLGSYPVKIIPSKTAIAPVNPTFLPQSENEREMCARTIYCTNIDKKVATADVKHFFESLCGEVYRLKMLGDHHHFSRIAFVEFVMAESATAALSCSGAVLGTLPIRVSPSKTPVRRATRNTSR